MKLLLMLLLIPSLCFGTNATFLEKNDKAPFAGVLLKEAIIKEMDKDLREFEITKKEVLTLKSVVEVKDERINGYQSNINDLQKDLKREKRSSFWSNIGYFTLGCILTGIATKVALESTRR